MNKYQKAQQAAAKARKADKKAEKSTQLDRMLDPIVEKILTNPLFTMKGYYACKATQCLMDMFIERNEKEAPGELQHGFNSPSADRWIIELAAKYSMTTQDLVYDDYIEKMSMRDQIKLGLFDYVGGWCKINNGSVKIHKI